MIIWPGDLMLPDSIPLDLWLQFGEFGFPLLIYDSSSLWVVRILAARLFIHIWKSSLFNKWCPIHFVHLCKVSEPPLVTSTRHEDWKLCHYTLMKEFKASEASDCNPWFLHNFKQSKWQVNINSVNGCLRSCLRRCHKCEPPPSCAGVQAVMVSSSHRTRLFARSNHLCTPV